MDILNPGDLITAGMLRANGRTVRWRMRLKEEVEVVQQRHGGREEEIYV